MLGASSNTVATIYPSNFHETRCRNIARIKVPLQSA
jgi:hypothetical protein